MPKVLLAAAALAATVPALAQTRAEDSGRPLSATLTGAAERPGPGDPDGSGSAEVRVNPGQGQVCFDVRFTRIDTPVMAHIHRGVGGVAGPVVVNFAVVGGNIAGCTSGVSRDLAMAIIRNPAGFYVNVHTATFPAGAIRGQLHK